MIIGQKPQGLGLVTFPPVTGDGTLANYHDGIVEEEEITSDSLVTADIISSSITTPKDGHSHRIKGMHLTPKLSCQRRPELRLFANAKIIYETGSLAVFHFIPGTRRWQTI